MEYVLSIIGIPQYNLKRALAPFKFFLLHIHDHFIPHARNNYRPHLLGHRSLALLSALLVTVKIFTLSVLSLGPILPAYSSAITVDNIISLTNQSRQDNQLGVLVENSVLNTAAQAKADDMLKNGYFSHNTPDGRTPWDFITKAGYSYLMAGENLAVNFTEAENVETAWMNSPGHKANILNKNFEQIGIGIAQGEYQGHTAIFVVQMFGTPVEQKVVLDSAPTKVQITPVPAPAPEQSLPVVASAKTNNPGKEPVVNTTTPAVAALKVVSSKTVLEGENLKISAFVSGPAARVVAYFGKEAIMLSPKDGGLWEGVSPLKNLAGKGASVRIRAFSMDGQSDQMQLADFSAGTLENYNISGSTPFVVSMFGHSFNPKSFENSFYLFFVAAMLSSLILAIGIKRHIQHLSLIANSSFVIIFAMLMWWAG